MRGLDRLIQWKSQEDADTVQRCSHWRREDGSVGFWVCCKVFDGDHGRNFIRAEIETLKWKTVQPSVKDLKRSQHFDIVWHTCDAHVASGSWISSSDLIVLWRAKAAKDEFLHAFEPRLATRARKYLSGSRIGVPWSFQRRLRCTHRGRHTQWQCFWNVCQMQLFLFHHVWFSAICWILLNLLTSILVSHGFAANYFPHVLNCRRALRKTPGATVAFACWLERSAHRSTVSHSGAARQTVIQGTCRMPWNAWN